MSYSLNVPCPGCKKRMECTDQHVLAGAISGIHLMPFGVGHLGAGSITLDCQNTDPIVAQTNDGFGME